MNLDALMPQYVRQFETYIPSPPDDELKRMFGIERLIRLNNNENPLGPPPAVAALLRSLDPALVPRYPSGDCFHLREKLAAQLGLTPKQLLFGNGANEVIAFVIKAFCEQGDNIVTADRTFAVYEWIARFSGLEARLAPLNDFGFDEEALLAQVDRRTKLVFICNPNNPTGSWWSRDRLISFLERLGPDHLVVLDEAYCEFMDQPDYPDGISLLSRFSNLIIFRTFSKMYGLAGLRIGYLAGVEQVVDSIRKTCIVYSVNSIAQVAALAAFGDQEFIRATRSMVREGQQMLAELCSTLQLPLLAGDCNFAMIRLPFSDTLAYRSLMQQGVMIRTMTAFRFPGWIRVSISTRDEMRLFCEALSRLVHSRTDRNPLARAYGVSGSMPHISAV
ncbi:histidinol-phosphate transaminase [Trichlorobacter lovleyi]|uniref:histidinol-phosphate transaminase n=1 Tax=Trichlorobacter lovleyi TaxID=313985 RepID=UPI0023F3B961|nr:histidinol-phosphate transaminase [Trichlorobacter lovleyi]